MQFLLVLLALFSCAPSFSGAQQSMPRFSGLSSCLQDNALSCINCNTRVVVDPLHVLSIDCEPLVQQDRSLSGRVCRELDSVLLSVARMDTVHGPGGCIEVSVQPKGENGTYTVREDPERVITQSVVIRGGGVQSVKVTLVREREVPDSEVVEYALMFRNSELVGVSGVWFDGSPGRMGVEDVSVLVVENNVFQYFSQGALDVYNTPTVIVTDTEFLHNGPFSTQQLQEYRGDSAGLSVAVNQPPGPPLLLHVYNSTFHNNSVGSIATTTTTPTTNTTGDPPSPPPQQDDSRGSRPSRKEQFNAVGGVVMGSQFTSRGGGLAVIVNDGDPAEVEVWGCEFRGNEALALGGGMYVGLDGRSRHSVTVRETVFQNNTSPSTGGGLHMSFLKAGEPGFDNRVTVTDSLFFGNEADYGGGVYFLPLDIDLSAVDGNAQVGVFVQFDGCSFIENHANEVGGAFGGAFHILSFNTKALTFRDCLFERNSVGGSGIVSTAFYPVTFLGNNTFSGNRGPSLNVIGSRVRVAGSLLFRDNRNKGGAQDLGALYVSSQGQIELTAGASLSFINNSGITGAGLYVDAPHVPQLFSKLVRNPLCVFLFEGGNTPPSLWHNRNVSMEFRDNEAMVASAVYINNLDLCSWSALRQPFFNRDNVLYWNFITYTGNVNKAHSGSTDPQWAVQTPPIQLDIKQRNVSAFPGQTIDLQLAGFDELGSVTSVSTRLTDISPQNEKLQFEPSSISLDRVNTSSSFSYLVPTNRDGMIAHNMSTVQTLSLFRPNRRIVARDMFNVTSRPCPPGLKLFFPPDRQEGLARCECDEERSEIITCDESTVTLNTHLWGSTDTMLNVFPCPAGYCRCFIRQTSGQLECSFEFDSDHPEEQCRCNRTGVVCGSCADGAGVTLLLHRCISCDSLSYLLIPLLVVVDTAVMVFLLLAMLPAPTWLYPTLCYLQLLPHFTEYFPMTFELVRPYLYYVSSVTGLYFPYDFCLSSELDAVGAHALRYLPPLLATVISVLVILIRSKLMRPSSWHGVWWLVLLLYTPAVHTSLSALYCPPIPANMEGPLVPRWLVDGNVSCFSGTHIPLGLLSIIVLGCCVVMIPVCVLVSLNKLPYPRWVRFLEEPLTCVYKDKYKWWSGVELGKRLVLVLFAVVLPLIDYGVIFALMIIIAICSFCKPYKQLSANLLDVVLSCDVLVLLLLRNTSYLEDTNQIIRQEIVSGGNEPMNGRFAVEEGECDSVFTGVTAMVAILTPFYYAPLALAVCVLVVWAVYQTYSLCHRTRQVTRGESKLGTARSPTEDIRTDNRTRTQTIVDLNELESETSELKLQTSASELLSCVPEKGDEENKARTNGTHHVDDLHTIDVTETGV